MAKFHDPKTGKTVEAPNLKAALEKFKPKPTPKVKAKTEAKSAPKPTSKTKPKKTEVM